MAVAPNVVHEDYKAVSQLATYPFEPYWPEKKLKICITGAGGFIASHLAKRLKSEGHYIVAADWKRNEHMPVRCWHSCPGREVRPMHAAKQTFQACAQEAVHSHTTFAKEPIPACIVCLFTSARCKV
jgi:hypothetical protein